MGFELRFYRLWPFWLKHSSLQSSSTIVRRCYRFLFSLAEWHVDRCRAAYWSMLDPLAMGKQAWMLEAERQRIGSPPCTRWDGIAAPPLSGHNVWELTFKTLQVLKESSQLHNLLSDRFSLPSRPLETSPLRTSRGPRDLSHMGSQCEDHVDVIIWHCSPRLSVRRSLHSRIPCLCRTP